METQSFFDKNSTYIFLPPIFIRITYNCLEKPHILLFKVLKKSWFNVFMCKLLKLCIESLVIIQQISMTQNSNFKEHGPMPSA